jgi:prefoldin subunit 5
MQNYAISLRQNPEALNERREILESHERDVQQRIQELTHSLNMIQWKIQNYKEIEQRNSKNRNPHHQFANSSQNGN